MPTRQHTELKIIHGWGGEICQNTGRRRYIETQKSSLDGNCVDSWKSKSRTSVAAQGYPWIVLHLQCVCVQGKTRVGTDG